jgi:hypothetical protein
MPKPPVWPALALTLLVADAGADPVRQHGAHQHGVAALNVAVEGESLYLELLTPAANLVGFEHAPRGPQQHAAVAAAEAALRDGAALLRPSQAARCRQREAEVPAGLGLATNRRRRAPSIRTRASTMTIITRLPGRTSITRRPTPTCAPASISRASARGAWRAWTPAPSSSSSPPRSGSASRSWAPAASPPRC